MPAAAKKDRKGARCMRCHGDFTRRTVRRHLKFGCTRAERRATKARLAAQAKKRGSRADLPRGRRPYSRRDPPSTPCPQPIPHPPSQSQRRKRSRRRSRSPPIEPCLSSRPDLENPTPLRHPDFAHDTPGAGPSGLRSTPVWEFEQRRSPAFEPYERETLGSDEPLTFADYAPWLEGLASEDILRMEFVAEIVRDGGYDLSPGDRLLLEAFNFKVDTDITSTAFEKLRFAFPTRLGDLPTEARIRTRVAKLSGIQGVQVHCCVNSCIAFTGAYKDLLECPHCGQTRYVVNPRHPVRLKPRRVFHYLPIIPRLHNLYRDATIAHKLGYRARRRPQPGVMKDIFDGAYYNRLRRLRVTVGGETLDHTYFGSPTDLALGLSTDGFGPFKSRKQTCWPLIAFNYNLPSSTRFRLENLLCLGVIPGPNAPKELDTFLEPFIDELEDLARGVPAYDAENDRPFCLRAYLLACFGDMPAVAKLMCMKGHNGKSPCRACHIRGVSAGHGRRHHTNYTPLSRPFSRDPDEPHRYDPRNLPLRTHNEFVDQALYVQASKNTAEETRRSLETGIHFLSPLARVSSLEFPGSFPHDFMHLMFQNIVPNLIDIWTRTRKYKRFGDEDDDYHIDKNVWEAIGAACTTSGDTIPSAFGARVPNLATKRYEATAESMILFATQIGPALLHGRFKHVKYYRHFVKLVELIKKCLALEITPNVIQEIREGFAQWVSDYERLYYRNNPERLRACTLPLHALLHVADDIERMGPVWCYWAFPTERFCGALARANKSKRFPYASINRRVLNVAQLAQIKHLYQLHDELNLNPRHTNIVTGARYDGYDDLVFVQPRRHSPIPSRYISKISAHLSDIVGVEPKMVRQALSTRRFERWGKVQQTDRLVRGDVIHGHLLPHGEVAASRDASYVKYSSRFDRWHWHDARARLIDGQTTAYGRVEHFIVLNANFLQELSELQGTPVPFTKPVVVAVVSPIPRYKRVPNTDLTEYRLNAGQLAGFEIIDVQDIQCLVGRITTPLNKSYIIDRTTIIGRLDMLDDEIDHE